MKSIDELAEAANRRMKLIDTSHMGPDELTQAFVAAFGREMDDDRRRCAMVEQYKIAPESWIPDRPAKPETGQSDPFIEIGWQINKLVGLINGLKQQRDLLREALPFLEDCEDAGPRAGRSPELKALIEKVKEGKK